jgi:hypothetical protein
MTHKESGQLRFADRWAGATYLAAIPLTNTNIAEKKLLHLIDALIAHPPAIGELFPLLEQIRQPLAFVLEELAHLFHNKHLPLAEAEEAAFQRVVKIWRRFGDAYALCEHLEMPEKTHPRQSVQYATLLHRRLYCSGMVIFEHYRARRELPAGLWLELHSQFALAEAGGVLLTPVEDALQEEAPRTHCLAVYISLLLLDIAGPYSNSVRHMNLIRRWAMLWAPLVTLYAQQERSALSPYCVELDKDLSLHQTNTAQAPGAAGRYLDTSRLGAQIKEMLAQLQKRVKPSQLGLGDELGGPVIQLLTNLSNPWTQFSSARKFQRFQASGGARVATGFDAMHFYVGNKVFEQPDSAKAYSREDYNQLFTFRDRVTPAKKIDDGKADFQIDDWQVINHSANGFRLSRSSVGKKIAYSQIIAVLPHDGEQFLLARTCWLMQEKKGSLIAGVAVLPGLPTPVGVRLEGSGLLYTQAFLLPALPMIKENASLVLPLGMYQPLGIMELYVGKEKMQLRLRNVIERGLDYERISYEPA